MMKCSLIAILVLLSFSGSSQIPYFSIPDSLKEGASEVILFDHTSFNVENAEKSRLTRTYRLVALDEFVEESREVLLYYDQFREIRDASVKVFSLTGKELESVKFKDFGDFSTKGFSVAADSRAKYYKVITDKYPYIVEVSYSIDYKGSLFYPTWIPQKEGQSVLEATLTVSGNGKNAFRHKSYNIEPEDQSSESEHKLKWTVRNRIAYEYEPYAYSIKDYAPLVYTAPNHFQMDGVMGDMSSWDGFGQWISKLNRNKDDLSEEDVSAFLESIPEDASTIDKIRKTYEYLQDNTRYVSIQLGLGGWQPFQSSFVHEKKFGDCKALSFYAKSLLDRLDIKSYYTLINAGKYANEVTLDFPMSHFNHAILTVPTEKDTLWLECTSQTNPFGYLGTFTSDRNALMVTEEGAKLVRTKKYSEEDNILSTLSTFDVQSNGDANVRVRRVYKGLEIGNNQFDRYVSRGASDQKKWFYDNHKWGDVTINSLAMREPSNQVVPQGVLESELQVKNAATFTSDRLFFKPFQFTNIHWLNVRKKARDAPFNIKYAFSQVDTINVSFPEHFFRESELQPESISTKYGEYLIRIIKDRNHYQLIRKLSIYKGQYDPSEYDALRKFIRKVQQLDKSQLVLINRT